MDSLSQADKINQVEVRLRGNEAPRALKAAARFRRESLKFLVQLSESDARSLAASEQPGDLINVVWSFYRFAYLGGTENRERAAAKARELAESIRVKPERLQRVIDEVKLILKSAAERGRYDLTFLPKTQMFAVFSADSGRTLFLHSPWDEDYLGLRQAIVYGALVVLGTEEGRMVRRCVRKVCGRIFLANRPKQVYCTRRCVNASNFERFKQEIGIEAYRKKHAETVRKSYRWKHRKDLKAGKKKRGTRT